MQQGDVLLFQTNDGGNISVETGIVEMSGGLETAIYLSLFGGNEDDDGRVNNVFNWWGNITETDVNKHYRSETQNLLQSIPAITSNLRRIEDAVKRDVAWLMQNKIASSFDVVVRLIELNKISIKVSIQAVGVESDFEFVENWKASI